MGILPIDAGLNPKTRAIFEMHFDWGKVFPRAIDASCDGPRRADPRS